MMPCVSEPNFRAMRARDLFSIDGMELNMALLFCV